MLVAASILMMFDSTLKTRVQMEAVGSKWKQFTMALAAWMMVTHYDQPYRVNS